MKKILLKTGFFVVCLVTIIFLLLPFLETTPQPAKTAALQPQVSTENPLTVIAKRLTSLFSRKERAKQALPSHQELTGPQQVENVMYARWPQNAEPTPTNQSARINRTIQFPYEQSLDFADASFQTDNGEWVLIQQVAPQSSKPGMHEVNVHDNPYDRYVRQEQARHFQPREPKQEIPDSKWARLSRPFKQFFGIEGARPVPDSAVRVHYEADSPRLASARTTQHSKNSLANAKAGSTYPFDRMYLPDITPQQWAKMSLEDREKAITRHNTERFSEFLSGERAAEQAAQLVADAKYPNPRNEKEQQEKESYKQSLIQQNKQIIRNGILESIQANAADKEPVDELAFMVGCRDASLPSSSCSAEDRHTPPQHESPSVLERVKIKNAQAFYESTNYVLPEGLPFTVVVGPTDPDNFQQMTQSPDPATQQTGEIYTFLYKQQQCESQKCYWVPNSNQLDPKLADALTTIGNAQLEADPAGTYATYQNAFVQEKLKNLGPQATSQQVKQIQQQALEQFQKYRPNWVPYTEQQLVELDKNTVAALTATAGDSAASSAKLTFPLVTDPAIAPEIAQLIGPTHFVYNQLSITTTDSPMEAGAQLTLSLAQNVNDAKEVINSVTKNAYQEGIRTTLNTQINQANQNGGGFRGLLDAVKLWGNKNSSGSKK